MKREWENGTGGRLTRLVGLAAGTLLLDITTKRWAMSALADGRTIHTLGGLLPLTLAFNTGIAFGIRFAAVSRGVLLGFTAVIMAALALLYRRMRPGDPYRLIGIALVAGGALGNLFDRLRWAHGVVDFIGPIDLGVVLFPIFNVADMGITIGALLIAASLGWEEKSIEDTALLEPSADPDGGAAADGGGDGRGEGGEGGEPSARPGAATG